MLIILIHNGFFPDLCLLLHLLTTRAVVPADQEHQGGGQEANDGGKDLQSQGVLRHQ